MIVTGAAINAVVRPYDMNADVTVRKIAVLDHLQKLGTKHQHMLVSESADDTSHATDNLVAIKLTRASREHPNFAGDLIGGVDLKLQVDFGKIYVTVN